MPFPPDSRMRPVPSALLVGLAVLVLGRRKGPARPRRGRLGEVAAPTPVPNNRHVTRAALWAGLAVLLVGAGIYFGHDYRLDRERRETAIALTSGDPDRAPELIRFYGCGGCHQIPGVPGARGMVGPSLAQVGQRVYIAGVLTNTPENMVRWIVNPPAVDAKTAMPATGISEAEARDVAAYLYSLP